MARSSCPSSFDCPAGARGRCPRCHPLGEAAKAAHAERMRKRHADRRGFEIPAWVPDDLREDFVDVAAMSGEEAAASHVRRLKLEAIRMSA